MITVSLVSCPLKIRNRIIQSLKGVFVVDFGEHVRVRYERLGYQASHSDIPLRTVPRKVYIMIARDELRFENFPDMST